MLHEGNDALLSKGLQDNAEVTSQIPPALVITGPTCSGKSTLALAVAGHFSGNVINADSMQVYQELRILTARPDESEMRRVPHALYGVRPAAEAGNVAWWRREAVAAMADAAGRGRLPILCGGTGLYLASLTHGLAEIPPPGPARQEARALLAELGAERLHARLALLDPATAARLSPADGQRIARAWEIRRATGQGLAAWQSAPALPPAPWRFVVIRLDPPRDALRQAIASRFAAMIEAGALDEIKALLALGLDPALPAMRAHGVPELTAFLRRELTLTAAIERAVLATGRYTKRQATWFRHHHLADPGSTHIIHARIADMQQFYERFWSDLRSFIARRVDAPEHPA